MLTAGNGLAVERVSRSWASMDRAHAPIDWSLPRAGQMSRSRSCLDERSAKSLVDVRATHGWTTLLLRPSWCCGQPTMVSVRGVELRT